MLTDFIQDLEKYAALEKNYVKIYPHAKPIGNYYQYFGITKLIEILEESEGKEIAFYFDKNKPMYTYI